MATSESATLAGRKAIVTGAGKGIGEAIARHFAAAGAEVVLVARTPDDLDRVAAAIRAAGGTAHCVPADMGQRDQVIALVERAAELMGGIDIVVSNAAATGNAPILDLDIDEWDAVQRVNVTGTLTLLKTAHPYLAAHPAGNALIISSIRALSGTPGTGAYGASKAALNHLTRTLAAEWGAAGIRVNAILPGPVFTPLMEHSARINPKIREAYENCSPIAGWSYPEDIAGPALFLVSEAARKVSGHLMIVDGGLTAINQDCLLLAD